MKIETVFKATDKNLKNILYSYFKNKVDESLVHKTDQYLYIKGDAPYLLVAHLDTVHTESPSIITYSKDGRYMMSPQGIGGDDRCGVYMILEIYNRLAQKPHVLFTMEEESGGFGAEAFSKDYAMILKDLKYIVELDRKGDNDAVFYDCENNEFTDFVRRHGFKESYGSFSDISIIAPDIGVAAVNLSCGYYNPHTQYEYVDVQVMNTNIDKVVMMLADEPDESFEYIERVREPWSKYSQYWTIDSGYKCKSCGKHIPIQDVYSVGSKKMYYCYYCDKEEFIGG